jgi:hypothetical protein
MRSSVAALEMVSQYVIFPEVGNTTTRPGSLVDAEDDTRDPSGRGSDACFEVWGSANVNVSGDGMLMAYCQTNA